MKSVLRLTPPGKKAGKESDAISTSGFPAEGVRVQVPGKAMLTPETRIM
jgi:hypothetical protein